MSRQRSDVQTDILALVDLDLRPCTMYGACLRDPRFHCVDKDFNTVLDAMTRVDAVVLAIPHCAGLPSKLVIVMEKLHELMFLLGEDGRQQEFPLKSKPLGLVGHGGMVEEPEVLRKSLECLKRIICQNLFNFFKSCCEYIIITRRKRKYIFAVTPKLFWPKGRCANMEFSQLK